MDNAPLARVFLAAAALGLAASAAPARAAIVDLKLIHADNYDRNYAAHVKRPFVARFHKGKHQLVFLGVEHTYSEVSPMVMTARDIIRAEKPDELLIEAFPNKKDPKLFLDYARKTCHDSYCEGGEAAFAALTAVERGVPFEGVEPSDAQVLEALEDQGFSETDLNGYYFVRWIPQLRASGRLTKGSLPGFFADFVKGFGAADFKYDDFVIWYQEKNGKEFLPELIDKEEVAPLSNGTLFTQRLSAIVDTARNRYAAQLLADEVERKKKVFVVLAAHRYFSMEEALTGALGEPTVRQYVKAEEKVVDEPNPNFVDQGGGDAP